MSIEIQKDSIIYILCPAHFATGGPEALHQLGKALSDFGYNVFMHYLDNEMGSIDNPVNPNYEQYGVKYSQILNNSSKNIIIFPETYCIHLWDKKYSNLKKHVWWLSVTNFFIVLKDYTAFYESKKNFKIRNFFSPFPIPTVKRVRKSKAKHIAHSFYSLEFLKENKFDIEGQISDYMSESFRKGENYRGFKEDIIIYNPKKNGEFLEKIRRQNQQYKWIPLENMTPEQVSQNMKKAKVYIDFGYHPGKERMPREACMMDCCLIIGKKGSAAYKEDMPILEKYRYDFEDECIPTITETIKECMENYISSSGDFQDYKAILLKEKETFENAVQLLFKKI
ncbi:MULTISPECIES: hypothetical protein [unclassified Chryseobacterium]|uniref:hypothetical protein n=1 Tax=unclassified Chryseobacterium TaxID=2593645 RepID=UPI0030104144